jgi:hypothetical protein
MTPSIRVSGLGGHPGIYVDGHYAIHTGQDIVRVKIKAASNGTGAYCNIDITTKFYKPCRIPA